MTDPTSVIINGEILLCDLSGAVYWPERQTLVLADLHLEKGSAYARYGTFLPPYDTRTTLRLIRRVIERFQARRVICLGDSLHDGEAADRFDVQDLETLKGMTSGIEWIWILGNHDPDIPFDLGGSTVEELEEGRLVFRHEATGISSPGELSGHYHPKASLNLRGRRITGRCFVEDGQRMMLPAFGAYAGGLDLRAPEISRFFGTSCRAHVIGRERLFEFPTGKLPSV